MDNICKFDICISNNRTCDGHNGYNGDFTSLMKVEATLYVCFQMLKIITKLQLWVIESVVPVCQMHHMLWMYTQACHGLVMLNFSQWSDMI